MYRRAVLIWCALLALAVVNGFVREAWLIPRVGDIVGRAVSTLSLSALIVILTRYTVGWIAPPSPAHAWLVGIVWAAMTLAFEFLAGHFLFGNPWSRLAEDYNLLGGRIWILVLITTIAAPRMWARARDPRPRQTR